MYDGLWFARDRIFCVTNNYRIGADEFFCLAAGLADHCLLDPLSAYKTFFGDSDRAKSMRHASSRCAGRKGCFIFVRPIDRIVGGAGAIPPSLYDIEPAAPHFADINQLEDSISALGRLPACANSG